MLYTELSGHDLSPTHTGFRVRVPHQRVDLGYLIGGEGRLCTCDLQPITADALEPELPPHIVRCRTLLRFHLHASWRLTYQLSTPSMNAIIWRWFLGRATGFEPAPTVLARLPSRCWVTDVAVIPEGLEPSAYRVRTGCSAAELRDRWRGISAEGLAPHRWPSWSIRWDLNPQLLG